MIMTLSPSLNAQSIELLSIHSLPESFNYSINNIVASRAVKFIGKLHSTLIDVNTRDEWWEGEHAAHWRGCGVGVQGNLQY